MAKRVKTPENEPPENTPSEPSKGARLTIQLDENGAIAWERMRPSTRDEILAKLKNDPKIGPEVNSRSHSSADIFSDPHAAMVFDLLGRFEVMIAMRAYHCSSEQAEILLYTDQEKAILTGPLVKVLNKYGGSWFTKYGDEIALAGLMVAVHAPKLTTLQDLAKGPKKDPIAFVKSKDVESS